MAEQVLGKHLTGVRFTAVALGKQVGEVLMVTHDVANVENGVRLSASAPKGMEAEIELPGYYECKDCFAIRPVKYSDKCPGCTKRRCGACRCGEAQAPPCPTTKLTGEEYDDLLRESRSEYLIEEDLLITIADLERVEHHSYINKMQDPIG